MCVRTPNSTGIVIARAIKYNPKGKTALICIGEGAEAYW